MTPAPHTLSRCADDVAIQQWQDRQTLAGKRRVLARLVRRDVAAVRVPVRCQRWRRA